MKAMTLKNLWPTTSTLLGMQTPLDHHESLSGQDANGYACELHVLRDDQLNGKAVYQNLHEMQFM